MKKKIFFTDLDETLLTSDKTISPATEEVLRRLTDAGHYVVAASGRSIETVMEVIDTLPISKKNMFYASYNGALIVDASTGKAVCEHTVSLEDCEYFLNFCKKEGVCCQSYQDGHIVAERIGSELEDYRKVIHMPVKLVDDVATGLDAPPYKCLALTLKGPQILDDLAEKLKDWAGDRITLVRSSDKLLEAFNSKAGKGNAVRFLADHLGVDIEDTLAAGDQGNDVSMLEAAGLGVAMLNGADVAKAAADRITEADNNHDGLVPILKEFFEL